MPLREAHKENTLHDETRLFIKMSRELRRKPYSEEAEIAKMQNAHLNGEQKVSVVLDLDETEFNTVLYWVEQVWNPMLVEVFGISTDQLPSAEQVFQAGGTDFIYKPYFIQYYGEKNGAEYYEGVANTLRASSLPNYAPLPMEEGLGNLKANIFRKDKSRKIIGAVTARPGVQNVMRATRLQFVRHNVSSVEQPLHQMALIGKPENVHLSQTTVWKITHLETLQALNPNKILVIIDDSLSLAKKLQERNRNRFKGQLPIIQVVYPGPNTLPKVIEQDGKPAEFVASPEDGIYLSNWENMDATLQTIEQTWKWPQPLS